MADNPLYRQLKALPGKPGVYLFKSGDDVLYVGKASSLYNRVRSYFSSPGNLPPGLKLSSQSEILIVPLNHSVGSFDFSGPHKGLPYNNYKKTLIKTQIPSYFPVFAPKSQAD